MDIKPSFSELILRILKDGIICFIVIFIFGALFGSSSVSITSNVLSDESLALLIKNFNKIIFVVFAVYLFFDILNFLSLSYSIKDNLIISKSGVLWRKESNIPYVKITNVDIYRGPLQRLFGIGNIVIQTAGSGSETGEAIFVGVDNCGYLKNYIMKNL